MFYLWEDNKWALFYGSEVQFNLHTTKCTSSGEAVKKKDNNSKRLKKRYNQSKLFIVFQWKNNKHLGKIPCNTLRNFPCLTDTPAAAFPQPALISKLYFKTRLNRRKKKSLQLDSGCYSWVGLSYTVKEKTFCIPQRKSRERWRLFIDRCKGLQSHLISQRDTCISKKRNCCFLKYRF